MYKLDGQGDDRNCFSNPFTNILPPPVSAFRQALAGSFGVAVCTVAVLPKDKYGSSFSDWVLRDVPANTMTC